MDAEETCVLRLDRHAEQQAFKGRGVRACSVAAHLSTEVRAVPANTEAPMLPTRSYSGQHLITLKELADEFGVSPERVRQIGAGAFEKVQKAVKSRVAMMETPAPLPALASNPVPWWEKLPMDVSPSVRFTATRRRERGTARRSTHRTLRHSLENL